MIDYKGNSEKSGIYQIRNKVNNKIYIGSSFRFGNRKSQHFQNLEKNIHSNTKLQNSVNKYGLENFIFELLEICSKDNLIQREQYWLDLLQPFAEKGYNILKIAKNSSGFKHSEETKRKISEIQIGKKVSQETKDLLLSYSKERKVSEETREKLRNKHLGKKLSEETKEKIKFARKNQIMSKESVEKRIEKILKSVNLFDLKDNLIRHFKSYKECAEYLNSPYSTIAYLIRKNKIYKKLFKFKINEE